MNQCDKASEALCPVCICQFLTVPFCTGLGSENPVKLRLHKDLNAFTNLNMRKKLMPRNICPTPGRLDHEFPSLPCAKEPDHEQP